MRLTAALLLLLALGGCSSTGTKVTDEQLSHFVKGKTTMSEVVAQLGTPTSRIRTNDGKTTLIYSYTHAQMNAATFIPVVGMFAGGATTEQSSAHLTFDGNGVLVSMMNSSGGSDIGTGLVNGQSQ